MHMVMVARAFERIGDNAVDIGEQTAFVVTGLFREFSDSSHPRRGRLTRSSCSRISGSCEHVVTVRPVLGASRRAVCA